VIDIFDAKTIWTIAHLLGVAIGAGGAYLGDVLFLSSVRDGVISHTEFSFLKRTGLFVWLGVGILTLSGAGLFFLDPSYYLGSSKFLAKVSIVVVIVINGVVFHLVHFKMLQRLIGIELKTSQEFRRTSATLFASGAVSVISWTSALILGSLRSLPFSVSEILSVYGILIGIGIVMAMLFRKRFLSR